VIDPQTPIGDVGERALVRHLRSRIPLGPGVIVGVGDDAAAVETGGTTLVTTDCLVEGIHFLREWTVPAFLGRKALSVNLSDIAAMAGVPRYATVSLCLPADLELGFVEGLYDGLLERAAETGVNVVGGNVSATAGPIVIDVTLLGQGDRILRRAGAVAGDLVVVTGTLGAAAEGVRLLRQGARLGPDGLLEASGPWTHSSAPSLVHCLKAHLDPAPPLAFGRALSENEIVHAAIDVSDGLSGDLLEICHESELAARLEAGRIPVNPHVLSLERARGGDALALALHGGEDYEMLLAVPPDRLEALRDLATVWDLQLSVLGEFTAGPPALSLKTEQGPVPLVPASHEHFRKRREPSADAGAGA
jgi:thiamine-monophosphate kinase